MKRFAALWRHNGELINLPITHGEECPLSHVKSESIQYVVLLPDADDDERSVRCPAIPGLHDRHEQASGALLMMALSPGVTESLARFRSVQVRLHPNVAALKHGTRTTEHGFPVSPRSSLFKSLFVLN